MPGDDPSYDPAAASHRALRAIRRELERHPAVEHARGFPAHTHSRVEAELVPSVLGSEAAEATLTVRWFAGTSRDADPEFSVHYSDEVHGDVGWHYEPNPHVDGRGHVQERPSADESYAYEPYEFATLVPARVVWEVFERLAERLDARGDQ